MPVPTLEKTWQFNVNNFTAAPGTAADANRGLLLNLKNALKGFGSSPWAVVNSSNGVAAGAGDSWSTIADILGNSPGSNHSWIVLRQTGIATNFELCIDVVAASVYSTATVVVSPAAGFTGGTVTNRPTATDEVVLVSAASWVNSTSNVAFRWSVMQSTDGACTFLTAATGGTVVLYAVLAQPGDPVSGWTNPSHFWWRATNPIAGEITSSTGRGRIRAAGSTGNVAMMAVGNQSNIGPVDSTWANVANQITNEWPMFPLTLGCVTSPIKGAHGRVIDMWAASSGTLSGDTYPGDASRQFAQFGALIVPWNGGPVNLT